MLVRISPEQLANGWGIISQVIREHRPEADNNEEKINNIFKAILQGQMVCWVVREGSVVNTLILTLMNIDEASESKNLLIYLFHVFIEQSEQFYDDLLHKLQAYGTERGCENLMAYCDCPQLEQAFVRRNAKELRLLWIADGENHHQQGR